MKHAYVIILKQEATEIHRVPTSYFILSEEYKSYHSLKHLIICDRPPLILSTYETGTITQFYKWGN